MIQKNPSPQDTSWVYLIQVCLPRNKVTPSLVSLDNQHNPSNSHTACKISNIQISTDAVGWENILGKSPILKEVSTIQLRKKSEVPPSCQITLIFTKKMDYIKKKSFI